MDLKNKKGYFNYQVLDEFIAGLILTGSEVKSVKDNDVNFGDSFLFFDNGEIFVRNLYIAKYKNASYLNHDEMRDRKVLLNKSEIFKISKMVQMTSGITMIPLEIFLVNNKIKMKIGVCKGKKSHDKRDVIKKRDIDREIREY